MRITHRYWVVASAVMFAPAASPSFAGDKVTIIRDTWGIPHVFAHTDRGAFYGAGYATAADRMYQMHRMRRVIQGRLAELVGLMHSGNKTTADQDANMRHRAFYKYAQRRAANLDPETLAMLEAYSDGVNRYIRDHQDELLYLFDGEVPEPWTPADCLAIWDRIADFFSGFPADEARLLHEFEELEREHGREEAIRRMTPKRIYDEDAAVVKREDLDPKLIAEMEEYARQHSKCEGGDGGGRRRPSPTSSPCPSSATHGWWAARGPRPGRPY